MGPYADSATRANDARYLDAIADAETRPYWLDDAEEPDSNPTLVHDTRADLCVVGGGFTGLWCAIGAKVRNPSRDVVLIDAHEIGSGASGRNGGFMDASVTHGIANAQRHFPDEVDLLERLGLENFQAIVDFIARHGIDCDCERTGIIDVASTWHTPSYVDELREDYEQLAALGHDVVWLDRDAMREEVHSPVFTAGLWGRDSGALLDPARLAWGLKRVAETLGVRIHEDTRATGLAREGSGMAVRTPLATIRAHRVALGTNTWRPLVRGAAGYVIPVYDYCLTTEPLSPSQLAGLGWRRRQGLSDVSNQFHYYRLTADGRVLWGGYDAIYHYGGRTNRELESRPESWARLARQFFETFPQLEGVRFSHMWGAPIDTCSRFSVFWDTAHSGRVAYAMGYTGLGVASSRFGAEVMLDLLDGVDGVATRTRFVRTKPRRWPPEPVRWLAIQQTRRSLEHEDRTGRRNWWLRLLDRIGLGFDT
jgi:glycine/D-amino acid oxidase-like deaminating enzyme